LGTDTGEVRIYNPRATSLATPLVNWSAISSASVRSLVFSPDGQTLVAGMGNAMVLVYQVGDASALPKIIYLKEDSGQIWVAYGGGGKRLVFIGASGIWLARSTAPQEVDLLGEPTFNTTYAISPDGRWLVVGHQDGRVVRWDLATTSAGSAVQLLGLGEPTFALAFSPDGRWLIGGGADRQVRRWDLTAADPAATVHILGEHAERVNSLAVSPDGQSVASASDDTTVHLWSIDQPGIEEQDLSSPTKAALTVVVFSPDGRWLASAGDDRLVRLWDLTAHSPVVQELHGSEDQIHRLSFSASGDLLVSQSTDGMLRVWSLAQPGPALPLQRRVQACVAHTANATALGLSPDAHTLAVGTDTGGMLLDVNTADLAASARCIPGTDMIADFAFSSDGRWLIVRSYNGEQGTQARVFDLQSQTLAPVSTFNGIDRLAVSVDRAWLALITHDKTIQLYDLRADTLDKPVWTTSPLAGQINDLKVASGGRWVALATADGTQLWNLQTSGEKPYLLPPGSAGIPPNIVAFSPDGRWLVIGESKSLRVWDLNASITDMPMLQDVGVAISDLAFSPDGHYLISIQNDGRIGVRRMEADGPAKTARLLSETTDSINPLVFSTDSSHLLSVDRVWDLTTSAAPLVLHKTDQSVNATFSADGNKVVAYVGQGTVLFWELRPAELAAMACRTAGRGLTQDERKTYAFDQSDQSDPCVRTP
ncbi:MAG: WD40 repeat domain-containing protein, partial [Oscillochloris sp.]|nr:WD40 repeat domain-containing protein [Oscillochloris sp.]